MPWPSNGCGTTSEFVELLNFGPGPVNIGCYVLTDGDYAVTIPANTILQPGEFYVLAGQDIISGPCANIDSTIHVDLNWNGCGCTSGPIPTTGDGFFTDGGFANEQVVLLNTEGQVVDAVIRDLPAEPSRLITTSSVSGCPSFTFDLDELAVNYEVLGMSTGRGNSFARKLDGDCGWVKDPQQSGNATNNTSGDYSDVTYSFNYISAEDCSDNRGSINVFVKRSSYTDVFPMTYTLAADINNDGAFGFDDSYTTYIDDTPPDMTISGLPAGRYRLTVESSKGCYLHVFNFSILPCFPMLPVRLDYFRVSGQNALEWRLSGEEVENLVVEGAGRESAFTPLKAYGRSSGYGRYPLPPSPALRYRLRMELKGGAVIYSPLLRLDERAGLQGEGITPNPVQSRLTLRIGVPKAGEAAYRIVNTGGQTVKTGKMGLRAGFNQVPLDVADLPEGIYQLICEGAQPRGFRFVKH